MRHLIRVIVVVATVFGAASGFAAAQSPFGVSEPTIFGRVMLDYANAEGTNTAFDVDTSEFRNVRLGLKGKIGADAKFKFEVHTDSSGDVKLTSAELKVTPNGGAFTYILGQFKTPNTLDKNTSSRFISTHERTAFTDAFAFNRRVGAGVAFKQKNYTATLGVFAGGISDSDTFKRAAVAGRVYLHPAVTDGGWTLHGGASFRYRTKGDDVAAFRYRQRPVTHIPGRIIGTQNIGSSDIFTGVEFAALKDGFWTAAEYGVSFVNCTTCAEDPVFGGGYVEAGYMIGGHRNLEGGRFERPTVSNKKIGAVAFVVRFDTIELNSATVAGGDYRTVVGGIDWWPSDHFRFGVNGFYLSADLGATGAGLDAAIADAIALGVREESVTGVTLRAQFDF